MPCKALVKATIIGSAALLLCLGWLPGAAAAAETDPSRYMAPSEVRAGMKGYGRTVVSGTRIDRFQFEVISVMSNAFYPKQDIILVRCSGLNLEHSGIVGGMSGSPCYITDEAGHDRMIGAVAYGWTFNKDPICGVQPITQMLDVAKVRDPGHRPRKASPASGPALVSGGAVDVGQLIARAWSKPIEAGSCFSVFNDDIARYAGKTSTKAGPAGLQPLKTPLMISGGNHPQVMSFLNDVLERYSLEPIASGGASAATKAEAGDVRLEPGSVLCIPMITGDLSADALGTCTEVDGSRVLGFGHAMDGMGWVELPLATGMVHTVVPSVMRSNKLGASLQMVGTLWGDESTGIFGVTGNKPAMVPVDVTVSDIRGKNTYHYNVAQDEAVTPSLLASTVMETVYAHSEPPREHTLRYSLETEFEGLGTFKSANFTSQQGAYGLGMSAMVPASSILNSPFGEAKVTRMRAEVTVEPGARLAEIDQVLLDRPVHKPGDTVTVRVRFVHYRNEKTYTEESYSMKLPDDLDDGEYQLAVCSSRVHLSALRQEKPHLFRAENLPELLERFNRMAEPQDNHLFLRLSVPRGGVAVKTTELPDVPAYRAQILAASRRSDVLPFRQALVKEFTLPDALEGGQAVQFAVSRRADQ